MDKPSVSRPLTLDERVEMIGAYDIPQRVSPAVRVKIERALSSLKGAASDVANVFKSSDIDIGTAMRCIQSIDEATDLAYKALSAPSFVEKK